MYAVPYFDLMPVIIPRTAGTALCTALDRVAVGTCVDPYIWCNHDQRMFALLACVLIWFQVSHQGSFGLGRACSET